MRLPLAPTALLAALLAGPALAAPPDGAPAPKKEVAPPPGKQKAEPFLNTRITFTFGDDNVLVGAGETKRSSPAAYFGNCPTTALDRTSAIECARSSTSLILYKRLTLHPKFQPEAALAIRLNLESGDFADDGTYIRANYFMSSDHRRYWAITLFPVDSDRMRLGFFWDVSWGGTDSFPKNFRRGFAPGLRFDIDLGRWNLWAGMKAALIRSPADDILDNPGGNTIKNVERTFYGGLMGTGVTIGAGFRFDVNGGFFHKGTNTRQNALGKAIWAGGFSGRLSWSYGLPIGSQVDIRIFQQDPVRDALFQKEVFGRGLSLRAEVEATGLVQTLEDPDHVRSTKNEWSVMGHLGFALKYRRFRLHLHGIYRDLTAITYDVPGFVPYQALSEDVKTTPEIYGSLSLDYTFAYDITVALTFGILKPATYVGTAPLGLNASSVDLGRRKVVVRGAASGDWDILPPGDDELPIYMVRLDLKWNWYDAFGVIAQVYYGRDPNVAQVFQNAVGHNVRVFDEPNAVGLTLITRVAF